MVALDIAKAFDTVDRAFLEDALTALGAGPGMVMWVHLLLSDTRASVQANGYESSQRVWHAGVRQGCPLSPILYLVVGQALASWLRAQPHLGLVTGGRRYVSSHMADDTNVFAGRTPQAQQALGHALTVFAAATGQAINLAKCKAVRIGAQPQPLPQAGQPFADVPQVDNFVSLGVPLYTLPPLPPPLHAHDHATRSAGRLPRDVPPQPHPSSTEAMAKRLAGMESKLEKVSRLPLSEMGKGLASSAYAASQVLYLAEFEGQPSPAALAAVHRKVAAAVAPGVGAALLTGKPKEGGFGCLPLEQHITARHASMALRLTRFLLPSAVRVPPWVVVAGCLLTRACPHLHPAQTLLLATESSKEDVAGGLLTPLGVPQLAHIPGGPLRRMAEGLQQMGPLCLSSDAPLPLSTARQVLTRLPEYSPGAPPLPLARLRWRQLGEVCIGEAISVRDLTGVLSAGLAQQRQARHASFAAEASGHHLAGSPAVTTTLQGCFKRVWQCGIDNRLKEIYYRLAGGAIPGGRVAAWGCPCTPGVVIGAANSRVHSFWACPSAAAVRAELQRVVQPLTVSREMLWLLRPPSPAMRPEVWDLVCLSALGAMEHGRTLGWALQAEAQQQQQPQPQQQQQRVAAAAVARFWQLLDTCISPNMERAFQLLPLGPQHPFLCQVEGRLVLSGQPL